MINISDGTAVVEGIVHSKKRKVSVSCIEEESEDKKMYILTILDFFDIYGILFLTQQWR